MRNFVTVSLPDELCDGLQRLGDAADPPASMQQMVRRAVELLLAEPEPGTTRDQRETHDHDAIDHGDHDDATEVATDDYGDVVSDYETTSAPPVRNVEPVDLLVFAVEDASYGIPIEMVETVAADLEVHSVPTSSMTLIGVADFRGTLTEVHDGGTVVQGRALEEGHTRSLLAVPGSSAGVLMTVTSVSGLVPAGEVSWADPPASAPSWALALAWNHERVITVMDPRAFNL